MSGTHLANIGRGSQRSPVWELGGMGIVDGVQSRVLRQVQLYVKIILCYITRVAGILIPGRCVVSVEEVQR